MGQFACCGIFGFIAHYATLNRPHHAHAVRSPLPVNASQTPTDASSDLGAQHLLSEENTTVADVAGIQLIHGLVDTVLAHWELLNNWFDLMKGCEVEHAVVDVS